MALIEYEVAPGVFQARIVDDVDVPLWQDVGWTVPPGVPIESGPETGIDASVADLINRQTSSVSQAVSAIVGAAIANISGVPPGTLNTLQELAAAIANDPSFAVDTLAQINTIAAQVSLRYTKPGSGIPASDLATGVQTALATATSAYQKPGGGVPSVDLSTTVQALLAAAGSAVQPGALANYAPVAGAGSPAAALTSAQSYTDTAVGARAPASGAGSPAAAQIAAQGYADSGDAATLTTATGRAVAFSIALGG